MLYLLPIHNPHVETPITSNVETQVETLFIPMPNLQNNSIHFNAETPSQHAFQCERQISISTQQQPWKKTIYVKKCSWKQSARNERIRNTMREVYTSILWKWKTRTRSRSRTEVKEATIEAADIQMYLVFAFVIWLAANKHKLLIGSNYIHLLNINKRTNPSKFFHLQ